LWFTGSPVSAEQGRDPRVSVAAVPAGELDDPLYELPLKQRDLWTMPLRGTGLAENTAGPSLGNFQLLSGMRDSTPPAPGAQKFPSDTSLRMEMSIWASARSFLRRAFSFSRSLRRLA